MLNERPYVTIVIGNDCPEWSTMTKEREEELKQQVASAVQKYFNEDGYNVGIEVVFADCPRDRVIYSKQESPEKDRIEEHVFEILGDVQKDFFNNSPARA
jgi:hypothetical protein